MRAAVFHASFDLALAEAPREPPGPGEVELRVGAAGLCAGDLYIYLGKNPYVTYPRIGGHEIAGTVAALGPGVTGVALGGPIGLAILEVARSFGAEVFITDIAPERLETARDLGGVPLSAATLAAEVARLTDGEGMPAVIETTGVASVMESTIDLVASGGRIVILGLVGKGVGVRLPGLELTRKEVTLHGSRASVDCFPKALRLIGSGAIRYLEIATPFPLRDAPKVFAQLAEKPDAYHKAVFVAEAV